jgi:hypothetical protein
MQIHSRKLLSLSALLACAGALAVACVSEEESKPAGTGGTPGTGGTAGSDASAAGTAGQGTAGGDTGGAGGTAGAAGGSAGSAGGGTAGAPTCLGDTATVSPDCSQLPYAATQCDDTDPEDTSVATQPFGMWLCEYMTQFGRQGVTAELQTCLGNIQGEACKGAHFTAVQTCVNSVFPQSCEHGLFPIDDGGTIDICNYVNDNCNAVTKKECNDALNAFKMTSVAEIYNCFDENAPADECKEQFEDCVYGLDSGGG